MAKWIRGSFIFLRTLCRRRPDDAIDGLRYLQADLSDVASLQAIGNPEQFTHLVYAGFAAREGASWSEVSAWNTALFNTLIDWAAESLLKQVRGNFQDMLAAREEGQPFAYWFGPTNVHRKWTKGSGKDLW